jgi:hypothetical protein
MVEVLLYYVRSREGNFGPVENEGVRCKPSRIELEAITIALQASPTHARGLMIRCVVLRPITPRYRLKVHDCVRSPFGTAYVFF